jgi:hypothetical protein
MDAAPEQSSIELRAARHTRLLCFSSAGHLAPFFAGQFVFGDRAPPVLTSRIII